MVTNEDISKTLLIVVICLSQLYHWTRVKCGKAISGTERKPPDGLLEL